MTIKPIEELDCRLNRSDATILQEGMTQLFRFLILGPLILVLGLIGWPLVFASVWMLEWYQKLGHES